MALALRGAAFVPAGNPTTSWSGVIPASVVANDLIYLPVTSRDHLAGTARVSVTDNDTGGNAWALLAESTDRKASIWWKRATSATAGKTVTVSGAVGSSSGVGKAFSGGSTEATPHTNVVVETNASGDESHAEFTPTNPNSMVCCAVFNYANDNAVTTMAGGTIGALSATEKLSTGGSDCACSFGHVLQSGGPAATGTFTWAQVNGTTYSITWAIKPAALTQYTLTGDAGNYALTGAAAALKAGRLVTADAGAYSHSGTAAIFRLGYRIGAESGSFAWTGTDAGLTVGTSGYTLTADPGSYVATGTPVTLRCGRRLVADHGTFVQTGTATALRPARRLAAASGNYAWAVTPAGLRVGRVLGATPGTFAWSGNSAELRAAHRLGCLSGAFVWTGTDATLIGPPTNYVLDAESGSFAWTGVGAQLLAGRTLRTLPGAFDWTGSDVSLSGARRLTGQPGSFTWTGVNAALIVWSQGSDPWQAYETNLRIGTLGSTRARTASLGLCSSKQAGLHGITSVEI